MKLKIKRIDSSLPLPQYKTTGAVALDLSSRQTMTIPPKEIRYIPLNVVVEIPEGYWLFVAPRSSTHKLGLIQANSIGIGDRDFCGENDEYHFAAFNFTDKEIIVEKGTRIAQMMVLPSFRLELEEVSSFNNQDRGGFGSTGLK